jgi:hypothetical protein
MSLGIGASAQVGPPQASTPNTLNGYGFAQSSGTYTSLSASRTIWQSGATLGTDAVSSAVTLPSAFKYNGKSYTNIYISNNGFITFGSAPLAATYTGLSTNVTTAGSMYEGAVAGFGVNLKNANTTTSEISYETVGSKFIVQFTDLQGSSASAAQLITFQIQLDSSNNSVAIVYGACASGAATLTGQVGLKGAESSDVNNRTGTNWTTTAIGTSNSSSCTLGTGGGTAIPASGLTFTFAPGTWVATPATYATLPFTESFGSWANGNSTADLPNATNWRTWPSRGDNSWRANNHTATAGFSTSSGWVDVSESTTTVIASPAVAPTARFHTYQVTSGYTGYMDLYVDMSSGGTGNRIISFDYRNQSGTDKLDVLLSTDGGATFTSVGSSLGVATSWTNKVFTSNSVAPNAILRFLATSDFGSDDIFIDNLSITVSALPPSCTTISAPVNAATGVAVTPTITWAATTGATSYLINLGTTPGGTDVMNGVDVGNVTTYSIPVGTPLNYMTQYYITIIPKNIFGNATGCTETSFTTANIPCPTVTALAAGATNVSLTPTFTWSAVTGATGYRITIGTTTGGTDIANNTDLGNVTTYTLPTPLLNSTTYYYTINSYSGGATSSSCTVRNFTTVCGVLTPNYTNNFATFPGMCWSLANGGTPATGPGTGSTNYWAVDGFLNSGTTGAAKINLYTTGSQGWLKSPAFNLSAGGYRVKFDYGLTAYSATTSSTMGSDDVVQFVVSTDGGTTWTVLKTWDTSNTPTNLLNTYIFDLSSYTGANTMFAIYGSDGTVDDTADYEFFVDNFIVETIPTCDVPTSVNSSLVTSVSATISWTAPATAPANGYEYYYSTTNTAPTSGTATTATTQNLTLLLPQTTYYYWVRSMCSGSQSTWVTGSFTTLAAPPANDNCSTPVALTLGGTFAQNAIQGTTSGATNTPALVASCLLTPTNVGGNVWYTAVVPASGNLTIETDAVSGSLLTDTVVSVFTDCSSTTSIGCDDDTGNGNFSKIILTGQTPGATLYISVWKYSTATDGTFQISAYDASVTLATSEVKNVKNNIKAYPNPFKDVLNISDISNVKSISVTDIAGRLVKTIDNPASALQLGDLNSGMYLVTLNMKDGSKQTIKVIKK